MTLLTLLKATSGGAMGFRSSTSLTPGGVNGAAVPVPSGAASGDIAVVGIYIEDTVTITPPSGFTLKSNLATSATAHGRLAVYWKRLTAADTGTYSFTWTGTPWRGAACGLWSGRIATGDPFDGTVGTAESASGVSTLNVSTSPAAANGDAVGFWTNFNGGASFTAPTNYTERVDTTVITLDSRDAVASGSTGNVTASATVSDFMKAFLGVLAVANGDVTATPAAVAATAAVPAPSVTGSANATATPSTVTATAAVPAATVLIGKYVTAVAGTGTGKHFVDQASNPILIRGYVLWGLLMNAGRWNAGDWQQDLEDAVAGLQAIGCNVIYTEPLGNTQNGGAFNNGNTHDGVAPFTGGDPATFNNTFWQRPDYLFDLCEAAGITVFFNFAYSDDLDTAALSAFTTADFTDYGTSLAARYKTRPNLVWMMGGDYFDTENTAITAVKTAIRAEGDTHLFGVQNYPETTSRKDIENNSTQSTGTDNSEFNFVYSYNTTYWGIEYGWSEASPLPVLWGDGHFDQDTTADRKVMRDLTWWAFSSGGRGMIFGSEGTWAWGSGALANLTTDTFPNTDLGGIWDLFAGFTNWHLLVPDTDNSFVTAGRGTKSDYVTSSGGGGGEYNSSDTASQYVTAAVAADGTLAVVYFPVDQTITVVDTELNAGYTATWVDPISGATSSATIASTYSPTGTNSLGGADWLLVFEAASNPNATPATVNATAAVPAVTLHTGATAVASVVAAVGLVPAPTLHAGAGTTPSTVTAVVAVPAPSVSAGGGAAVTAVTVAAVTTVPAVAVQTGSLVAAVPVAAVTAIPTPSVQTSGNATVTPSAVAGVTSVPAPTVKTGATAVPAVVAATGQIPAVTVSTGSVATPASVAGTATIPTPAVSAGGSASAAPATVSAVAGVPSPSLMTGSKVTATTATATATIPAPTVSAGAGATATPAVVVAAVVIPAPSVRVGAEPATVQGTAAIPAPSLHTSVQLPVFSVAAVVTIPAPTVVTLVAQVNGTSDPRITANQGSSAVSQRNQSAATVVD